uniref:Uncharacterized protein n=1 Tax=Parascaris univalens TaxID=6257 RepID=A0A914ZJD0_PARUN
SYLLLQHSVESSIDSYIICCVSEQKLMIDSICQDSRNFDFCSFRVFRSRPLFDIAETAFFFVISSSGPLDRCVVYRSRTDEVGEKNANTAILRSERGVSDDASAISSDCDSSTDICLRLRSSFAEVNCKQFVLHGNHEENTNVEKAILRKNLGKRWSANTADESEVTKRKSLKNFGSRTEVMYAGAVGR